MVQKVAGRKQGPSWPGLQTSLWKEGGGLVIASEKHTLLILEMPTMKTLVSRDTIEKIEKEE